MLYYHKNNSFLLRETNEHLTDKMFTNFDFKKKYVFVAKH